MCCFCRFIGGGIIVLDIIISVGGTFEVLATSCASVGLPSLLILELLGGEHAGDIMDLL
jgi:hypothetical protein